MLILFLFLTFILGLTILLVTPKSKSLSIRLIALICSGLALSFSSLLLITFSKKKYLLQDFLLYTFDFNLYNQPVEFIIGLDGFSVVILLFSNFFTFLLFLGILRESDFKDHALIILLIDLVILIIACLKY